MVGLLYPLNYETRYLAASTLQHHLFKTLTGFCIVVLPPWHHENMGWTLLLPWSDKAWVLHVYTALFLSPSSSLPYSAHCSVPVVDSLAAPCTASCVVAHRCDGCSPAPKVASQLAWSTGSWFVKLPGSMRDASRRVTFCRAARRGRASRREEEMWVFMCPHGRGSMASPLASSCLLNFQLVWSK